MRELLHRHGIKSFRMVPVKRSYAFELGDVPHGEQWVLKVRGPTTAGGAPHALCVQRVVAVPSLQERTVEKELSL